MSICMFFTPSMPIPYGTEYARSLTRVTRFRHVVQACSVQYGWAGWGRGKAAMHWCMNVHASQGERSFGVTRVASMCIERGCESWLPLTGTVRQSKLGAQNNSTKFIQLADLRLYAALCTHYAPRSTGYTGFYGALRTLCQLIAFPSVGSQAPAPAAWQQ
jgi:hypothetical protein